MKWFQDELAQVQRTDRWETNWQVLVKQLEWTKGFCLIIAIANDSVAVQLLQRELGKRFSLSVIVPKNAVDSPLLYVLGKLSELMATPKSEKRPVWIDLHGYSTYRNENISVFLSRLNERREWLRNHLAQPVILILPEKTEIRKYAPDLWFIRDLTLYLDDSILPITNENRGNMSNSILSFLQDPITQLVAFVATILGGGGWAVLDYFWQKWKVQTGKITVNKSLLCRLFPRFCFRKAYLRHVSFEHRVFNIKGLRTRGTYTIELEHVFVELRIAPMANPNQLNLSLVGVKELQGNQDIWQFLRYAKQQKEPLRIAIIGAPGSGKTTLLQHLALVLAVGKAKRFEVKFLNSTVPLLLALRQHTQAILEKQLLADIAQTHFSGKKRYPDLSPPEGWFTQQLQMGKCLVLLDGLDEVAQTSQRRQVSDWIDEQIVNYPRCQFIITSRPYGYQEAPLNRVDVLEVQPFNQSQVSQFINAWYLANEVMSFGGKKDAGVVLRAEQEAQDLGRRLQKRPELMELTVNPLLLTMIAMVHRYRGQLPGRRVELYAEICDVLLSHWREAKGIQEKLTAAQKRVALQPLAAKMMESQVRELSTAEALTVIRAPLQTVGVGEAEVESFLEEVQKGSGLLLERERGVWSFAHLTFQEYLAAAHWVGLSLAEDSCPSRVAQSWWQETLRLYAAQADATPIVRACLQEGSVLALTLAADCLEEALKLDATVREEAEQRLIAGLEAEDNEQRKLAAEVKLKQRLKRLQRLDEHREIDLHFIGCAEYQLFLDEKRAEGKFYQPDHWLEYQFSKGEASLPITGVRPADAVAFCQWLSEREGVRYRLPTREEAQENQSLEERKVATWCQVGKEEYGLGWSSSQYQGEAKSNLTKLFANLYVNKYLSIDEVNLIYTQIPQLKYYLRDLDLDLVFDRVFDLDRVFDRVLDRVRVLDLDRVFDLVRDRVRDLVLDRVRDLVRDLVRVRKVDSSIKERNFQEAYQQLQTFSPSSDSEQRGLNLLKALLKILMATTTLQQQVAWRRYAAYLLEYAVMGYEVLEKEERTWWQRLRGKASYHQEKRELSMLYSWLQIVIAREEGKLPAWEGIRVVRERE